MIQRKTLPVDNGFSITVVTEQMADGSWAVVASVTHHSATGDAITDLPVRDTRYPSQDAAEDAGVHQARDWIAQNAPRAA